MNSVDKYQQLGANYHWKWAASGNANPYVRWVKRVLKHFPDEVNGTLSVLDVGCGDGYPASILAAMGYDVYGVDIYEPALEVAKQKVPTGHFSLVTEEIPVCDYVLAFEVIEHMDSPEWLVQAVKAVNRFALVTCPQPGHDKYATKDYTLEELTALFEGCEVEVLIDEGEHRLLKVTPTEFSDLVPVDEPKTRKKNARRRSK